MVGGGGTAPPPIIDASVVQYQTQCTAQGQIQDFIVGDRGGAPCWADKQKNGVGMVQALSDCA